MRIISERELVWFWSTASHRDAKASLSQWREIVRVAGWRNPAEVKATFGKRVDFVETRRGNTVAAFDIAGNKYRMITAIHYLPERADKGRVYVLRIMRHREYDQDKWKQEL